MPWTDKPCWTVKPLVEKISDQLTMQVRPITLLPNVPSGVAGCMTHKVSVQDLIDTPLDEAMAKLEARVAENKIALEKQELELRQGRIALDQLLNGMAEWRRYKAEYIAEQLRVRDEKLKERRAAKRARFNL